MSDVFEQTGRPLHNTGRNPVQIFVVDGCTQTVAPGRFREVGGNDNIDGIFIADLLLFVVKAVVRKKFESF